MSESERAIHAADALKSLDQVLIVDIRNQHIEMAAWHAKVAEIELKNTTPKEVRQLFENAKNVALYAYFAYRLHQSAQIVGYSALERALKMKFELENGKSISRKPPRTLSEYMDIALEEGWITDEGYGSSRGLAAHRVQTKAIYKMIDEGKLNADEPVPVPEPEEEEIVAEMRLMGVARGRLHAGRHVRNFLAHGEGGLSPSSVGTLRVIAEEINQLF